MMRTRNTALITVLAIFTTLGLAAAPASAGTPATDQYTEGMPGPGGDVPSDPPKTGLDDPSNNSSDNPDATGATTSGSDSDSDESGVAGSKGNSGKPGHHGKATHQGQGDQPGWDLVNKTDPGTAASGSVPASVVAADSGGGLGWVFPAMLIAVATAVLGFSLGRRRSGSA